MKCSYLLTINNAEPVISVFIYIFFLIIRKNKTSHFEAFDHENIWHFAIVIDGKGCCMYTYQIHLIVCVCGCVGGGGNVHVLTLLFFYLLKYCDD